MLALPLTLALQWGLQSRYLNHPQGVAQLAGRRRGLLVGAAALVAVPAGSSASPACSPVCWRSRGRAARCSSAAGAR